MESKGENNQLIEKLKQHVYSLAQAIGNRSFFEYEKLEEAAGYIKKELASSGYRVGFQEFSLEDRQVKNIIATKPGKLKPQEIIIVGAHYDTCFNPGADDNASAIAGMLELASFLFPVQTNRTIKFIAFVNEEPPFFRTENMGSRVYAKEAKKNAEDIRAAIILEMIGYYSNQPHSQKHPPLLNLFYPHQGNFICLVGNLSSRRLVNKIVTSFKSHSQFPIESFVGPTFISGIDFSDHWSFWKEGYPAVMVTDTAFYRYPHYHSNLDTYEKLDYKSMAEVVRTLSKVLIELGE